jgi:hypothetical protein
MNKVQDRLQGGNDLGEASNAAIMFTFRVAMDTFNLAQGRQKVLYRQTTLKRLVRGDKSAMFQTRG